MIDKKTVQQYIEKKGRVTSQDLVKKFGISRQYASTLLRYWVHAGLLLKHGSTRNAEYVTYDTIQSSPELVPNIFQKKYTNKSLEEHAIIAEIESRLPALMQLKIHNEHIYDMFYYALSEILNNAIEHSRSKSIQVTVTVSGNRLFFTVRDYGIGVFRNVMKKRKLASELEAMQDILKGKTTTAPRAHSGEGIFFTSKIADVFILKSYEYHLTIDNVIHDIFPEKLTQKKSGTTVTFSLDTRSKKQLNDTFKKYTGTAGDDRFDFDKTEIRIQLYAHGSTHISRSQAKRVLSGLEKFKTIILDFDKVRVVGQGFVDEIFRVFQNVHPNIKIREIHAEEAVQFMINRVKKDRT